MSSHDESGTAFPATAPGMSCTTAGLSKREYFAGQSLSGLVSLGLQLQNSLTPEATNAQIVADQAVAIADALIARLEHEPDTTTAQQIALGIGGAK